MKVTVNGAAHQVEGVDTLAELLVLLGIPLERRGTAVARNGEVVPRTNWRLTPVVEGDRLEIITAVQGG